MRGLPVLSLLLSVYFVAVSVSWAEDATSRCASDTPAIYTPEQALDMLGRYLSGPDALLRAPEQDVMRAFSHAVTDNPEISSELALVISSNRPDLRGAVQKLFAETCGASPVIVISPSGNGASPPLADQMAAQVLSEGAAPGAGPPPNPLDANGSPD